MKKVVLAALLIFMASTAMSATKDVQRFNIWGHLIFKSNFGSGFGIAAAFDTRNNVGLKTVNGVDKPVQGSFLNEIFIGPSWGGKIAKGLSLYTAPQYRFMMLNLDPAGGLAPVFEHTIHWPTVLTYNLMGVIKLQYRLILWNRFTTSDEATDPNAFLMRHYFGAVYPMPFYKKLKLVAGYEIFHLLTPTATEQQLWRHGAYAGFMYNPVKGLALKLDYVYYWTAKETTFPTYVSDHYLKMTVVYNLNLAKKK